MAISLFLIYFVFTLAVLYRGLPTLFWEVGSATYLLLATFVVGMPWWCGLIIWVIIGSIEALLRLPLVGLWFEHVIYQRAIQSIPKLSKTEEEALSVGDTWLEADIFQGNPNWSRLSSVNTTLTDEEQAFLDNEVVELCQMLDEWSITQHHDLPDNVWQFIRDKGFFALVIDKVYGGKGFSARAHSDVVMKIASRSTAVAVTVMVPNSLGPGELLQYYGTDEQKQHYLPRLAKGIEIPCFALTEPGAGSDATSIQSEAIVMMHKIDGKSQLALKINLNKRWITLSPIATLIGLAVSLKDPEGLLKGLGQEGITCVLIPRDTPNLEIGNRHIPANQSFMNGTIRGDDIIVPITTIIGGQEKAGCGWKMLVECLSIGRSISLPALGAASSSVAYLTTGAFARVRRQFGVEIAQFEGVEEKLAEIAGLNYLINATRLLTVAAVNEHKKPSVASAITKYFNTELARIAITDAMDVHAGRGVVTGPRNYLFNFYQGIPISITVEGANIMSRNLLIFGQGSMACHPFIKDEFYAISAQDNAKFVSLLWQHIRYFMTNWAKTMTSTWTSGRLIDAPNNGLKRAYQRLAALSHAFAWLSDFALIYLGGELKRKERLSARLADAMSYLYLAMGALRQFETNVDDKDNALHATWATQYCFYQAQKAMINFCDNFPSKIIGRALRLIAFPFGQTKKYPGDKLDNQLSRSMTRLNSYRASLKRALYISGDPKQPLDKMEHAFNLLLQDGELYKKVAELRRAKFVDFKHICEAKVKEGALTKAEMTALVALEKARWDALMVDEFEFDAMKKQLFPSVTEKLKTPFD